MSDNSPTPSLDPSSAAEVYATFADTCVDAAQARAHALAEQPWSDCLTPVPAPRWSRQSVDDPAPFAMPRVRARELWGRRLAADFVVATEASLIYGDDDQRRRVDELIDLYTDALEDDPEHLSAILFAAVRQLAEDVPALIRNGGRLSRDSLRDHFADAARKAWNDRA